MPAKQTYLLNIIFLQIIEQTELLTLRYQHV